MFSNSLYSAPTHLPSPISNSAPMQAKLKTDLIPHKHTKHLMPLFPQSGQHCQIPYFFWLISNLTESNTQIRTGINLQKHTRTLECLTGAFNSKVQIYGKIKL